MTFDPTDQRLPERFRSKFGIDERGCWVWTANTVNGGYGRVRLNGRMILSHRLAYEALSGPIPDGLQLDHLCRNRACCNPEHLEPVTNRENVMRGVRPAQAREQMRGHAYSRGEANAKARLTEEDVLQIRRLYATGKFSHRDLGVLFKIGKRQIGYITTGKTWRHLGGVA